MRQTVERDRLTRCNHPEAPWAIAVLDALAVPDEQPFFRRADGTDAGYRHLNVYLHDLAVIGGRLPASVSAASYQLAMAHTFVADRHHAVRCACRDAMTCRHGAVELTEATREDLRAFQTRRSTEVESSSWNNQASALSAFFRYARQQGWIERDPIPRWGSKERNTLLRPVDDRREPRYLTQQQLHAFITLGLRADREDAPPPTIERDYSFGLTLVATGLRVAEAAPLLDIELPTNEETDAEATLIRRRVKGGRLGQVIFTSELARAIDLYRASERRATVTAAQRTLRKKLRANELFVVDRSVRGARPRLVINGRSRDTHRLTEAERAAAVEVLPDGTIEPLPLFVGRFGGPITCRQWTGIFTAADNRVRTLTDVVKLPGHHAVTPHVMRHTFAVQMLAALMELGRERASDPYHLLTNPMLTVQALMRHADPQSTMRYLRAAENYDAHVPIALRAIVASIAEAAARDCNGGCTDRHDFPLRT